MEDVQLFLQYFKSSEMFHLNATNDILLSWITALTFYQFLCVKCELHFWCLHS